MTAHKIHKFPRTRIATNDVCAVGLKKHHITALIELDVTESRLKIKELKRKKIKISFTAWILKVIAVSVKEYESVGAYLKGRQKLYIFDDINVSMPVEKLVKDEKVPIPLIIEKADKRSIESNTKQIDEAKNKTLSEEDIVLHKKSNRMEGLYYSLPGFMRRWFWHYMLTNPRFAYKNMGNVAITSIGMMGSANGWFIPISVHPLCVGIGKINKKAVVINNQIEIREILNLTILMDHDVIDGANMARSINTLSKNVGKGSELE